MSELCGTIYSVCSIILGAKIAKAHANARWKLPVYTHTRWSSRTSTELSDEIVPVFVLAVATGAMWAIDDYSVILLQGEWHFL